MIAIVIICKSYKTIDKEGCSYVVKKYNGTLSNVVISANHNNLPVTSIGQFAFSYCDSLTNV
ncbi:MAG: hypothetical protein MR270_05100 [Erysipelotrichaceae bacterium]|nr:hypothetical protein [Erysipelotrichaceae bacterium]